MFLCSPTFTSTKWLTFLLECYIIIIHEYYSQVMNSPVAVLRTEETVERVMHVIDTINHSGFPVVDEYVVDESQQNKQDKDKEDDSRTEQEKGTEESQV